MDLYQLKNFVLVTQQGNISAVAREINLSQPSLSRQMKLLEDEFGVELFKRNSKSITPTPAALMLKDEAIKLINFTDNLVTRVRQMSSGGQLRIGYSSSWSAGYMSRTLAKFTKANPRVKITLHDISCSEMQRDFALGKLDIIVSGAQPILPDKMTCHPLAIRQWKALIPAQHPLAKKTHISAKDLAGQIVLIFDKNLFPDYWTVLASYFKKHGIQGKIGGEYSSINTMQVALAANMGISLVLESTDVGQAFQKDIVSRGMEDAPEALQMYAAHETKDNIPAHISHFIALLTQSSLEDAYPKQPLRAAS